MPTVAENSTTFLAKCLASERIHSGYVISGLGEAPRAAALDFARGIVCEGLAQGSRPCETCDSCRRSASDTQPIDLDGREKPKGPAYRHVCDHSDLFWVELGSTSTRVTVWQIRSLQAALGRPSAVALRPGDAAVLDALEIVAESKFRKRQKRISQCSCFQSKPCGNRNREAHRGGNRGAPPACQFRLPCHSRETAIEKQTLAEAAA